MNRRKGIILISVLAAVLLFLVVVKPFGARSGKSQNSEKGKYYELKDEMKVGFSTPADVCFVRDDDGSVPDEEMDQLIELFGHHKLGIKQGVCSAGDRKGKKLLVLNDAEGGWSEVVLELDDSYDISKHPNDQGIADVEEDTCSYRLFPIKAILSIIDLR
ncbi:MAG: hypothetical protein IJU99_00790 [Lachnospiraceae bacterium]|nr:hypothetical protein [Lachnospiraceae bacterium]